MKRILPVLLALVVCFTCLISPAAAADLDESGMIEALDYQESNSFYYYPNSTEFTVRLTKPKVSTVSYAELLVYTNYKDLSVHMWYKDKFPLTVISLGNNLYRCIWDISTAQGDFTIYFSGSNAATYLNIVSLKYCAYPLGWTQIPGQCLISNSNYTDTISYNPSDATNNRQWTDNGSYLYTDTILELNATGLDASGYDYISFVVSLRVNSVTSISCFTSNGVTPIPFTSSIVDNSTLVANMYTVQVTMDLRNIDKLDSTEYCRINCQTISGELNVVDVVSISGLYTYDDVNPVLYWLKNIKASLSVWFTNLIDSVDSLANGSTQDQTNASDFNAAVTDQQQELEDMSGVMDSVTRPPVDDVDIDFDQYVSQDDISGMTSPLEALFTGDIFGVVLIMSIMMGTVSFVFYGKR